MKAELEISNQYLKAFDHLSGKEETQSVKESSKSSFIRNSNMFYQV